MTVKSMHEIMKVFPFFKCSFLLEFLWCQSNECQCLVLRITEGRNLNLQLVGPVRERGLSPNVGHPGCAWQPWHPAWLMEAASHSSVGCETLRRGRCYSLSGFWTWGCCHLHGVFGNLGRWFCLLQMSGIGVPPAM